VLSNYSGWYFNIDNSDGYNQSGGTGGIPAIRLDHACLSPSSPAGVSDTPFLVHVTPIVSTAAQIVNGRTYHLIIWGAETDDPTWNPSTDYIVT
jgi:hypothetical protein